MILCVKDTHAPQLVGEIVFLFQLHNSSCKKLSLCCCRFLMLSGGVNEDIIWNSP